MIRVVQVCPFHIGALEMGGPLTLMRMLGTAPPDQYKVVGLVTPWRVGQISNWPLAVVECRERARYRTVLITELSPLKSALENCDVAFIHGYRHWLPTWAAYYCRRKRKPYIIHLHGMANRFGRSRIKKLLFDRAIGAGMLGSASQLICSSRVEMRNLLTAFPSLPNVTVVPHGCDGDTQLDHHAERQRWQARLGLRSDQPLILALGRINRTKCYEAVIRALAGVSAASLVVVGPVEDRPYWLELQGLAASLGIVDRLHFIAGLYGEEKSSLLSAASVFVTTSLIDSFSLAVAEAVAQGTPVVFPQWIGIAEYLQGPGCYPCRGIEPAEITGLIETAISGPRVPVAEVFANLRWQSVLSRYGAVVQEAYANSPGPMACA